MVLPVRIQVTHRLESISSFVLDDFERVSFARIRANIKRKSVICSRQWRLCPLGRASSPSLHTTAVVERIIHYF